MPENPSISILNWQTRRKWRKSDIKHFSGGLKKYFSFSEKKA
jgi:hypothetical protein